MSTLSAGGAKGAQARKWLVGRDGFEPEVSLAVLPTAQSETPVPPKSATEILAQETGARSPCAAPDAEAFPHCQTPRSFAASRNQGVRFGVSERIGLATQLRGRANGPSDRLAQGPASRPQGVPARSSSRPGGPTMKRRSCWT